MGASSYTLAICDDNDVQLDMLEEILNDYVSSKHMDLKIIPFSSGEELMKYIKDNGACDIYILDMILPGMNGLEIASTLRYMEDDGKIIFLTSSLEYAVSSYDVKAFYYMVKPLDVEKMYKVLDNAFAEMEKASPAIVVKTVNGDVRLEVNEIMYIDLINRCLNYHMRDGRVCIGKTIRGSFTSATESIEKHDSFAKCGVSTVVNLEYVNAIDSETVLFQDGSLIYPSRSGIADLKNIWKKYNI